MPVMTEEFQTPETNPQAFQMFNQTQPTVTPKRKRRTKAEIEYDTQNGSTPTSENSGKTRVPKGRTGWENAIREQLNGMWAILAMPLSILNPVDAKIFTQRAPKITEALIHLAQTQPAFKRFLLNSSEKMVYSEIVIAILPIIVLVGVNHKMIPSMLAIPFGGVPSEKDDDNGAGSAFDIFSLFSSGMAAGGAPDTDWADRERENNDSAEIA